MELTELIDQARGDTPPREFLERLVAHECKRIINRAKASELTGLIDQACGDESPSQFLERLVIQECSKIINNS